jgi:hypothetical protein
VSWWDWQGASPASWLALSRPAGSLVGLSAAPIAPSLGLGTLGDLVVWAQEHLITAGYPLFVDGGFGPQTEAAVESFQLAHGLTVDGIIGPETWQALVRYAPAPVHWTAAGGQVAGVARFSLTMPVPKSSRLPAKHDELAGAPGAGYPSRRG